VAAGWGEEGEQVRGGQVVRKLLYTLPARQTCGFGRRKPEYWLGETIPLWPFEILVGEGEKKVVEKKKNWLQRK